jgi:hypothetical protein
MSENVKMNVVGDKMIWERKAHNMTVERVVGNVAYYYYRHYQPRLTEYVNLKLEKGRQEKIRWY